MDMEGRSLGTERPSVSTTDGAEQPARERFADVLSSRTADGSRQVRQARQVVEDDVADRIRDGRTDAADASEGGGDVRDSAAERPAEESARTSEREFDTAPDDSSSPEGDGADESHGEGEALGGDAAPREEHPSESEDGDSAASAERETSGAHDSEPYDGESGGPMLQGPIADWAAGVFKPGTGVSPVAPPPVVSAVNPFAMQGTGASSKASVPINNVGGAIRIDGAKASTATKAKPMAPPPSMSQAERAQAIVDQLRVRISAGEREVTIRLRPIELGHIEMKVRVDGSNITASILAESSETLAVLEQHAPELRAWLSKGGEAPVELNLGLMDSPPEEQSAAGDLSSSGQRGRGDTPRNQPVSGASLRLTEALTHSLSKTTDGIDLVA